MEGSACWRDPSGSRIRSRDPSDRVVGDMDFRCCAAERPFGDAADVRVDAASGCQRTFGFDARARHDLLH